MTRKNGSTMNGHAKAASTIGEMAISPNAPEAVPDLVARISSLGKSIALEDSRERLELLEAARSLTMALETPREAILRHCWSGASAYAAIEMALEMGLFASLSSNDQPKSVLELAGATGSDPVLLSRVLKHLCSMGIISETGPDEYRTTNFSTVLSIEQYGDGFPLFSRTLNEGVLNLPAFFNKANSASPSKSAFQMALNTDKNFFEYAKEEPLVVKQFANHMSVYRQGRPSWMDSNFYPINTNLVKGTDIKEHDVLLVDMGGSTGHDLSEFHRKWPNAPGRLILQDLPEVVREVEQMGVHSSIEPMAHDFFTEQPVKGARAYYMHSVLHDWPDDECRTILSNIIPAMRPGYSKVLINENVVPATDAHWETTSLDFIMMSIGSGERTEQNWIDLIESAGLKIVKIWTAQKGVESLIECELA